MRDQNSLSKTILYQVTGKFNSEKNGRDRKLVGERRKRKKENEAQRFLTVWAMSLARELSFLILLTIFADRLIRNG